MEQVYVRRSLCTETIECQSEESGRTEKSKRKGREKEGARRTSYPLEEMGHLCGLKMKS